MVNVRHTEALLVRICREHELTHWHCITMTPAALNTSMSTRSIWHIAKSAGVGAVVHRGYVEREEAAAADAPLAVSDPASGAAIWGLCIQVYITSHTCVMRVRVCGCMCGCPAASAEWLTPLQIVTQTARPCHCRGSPAAMAQLHLPAACCHAYLLLVRAAGRRAPTAQGVSAAAVALPAMTWHPTSAPSQRRQCRFASPATSTSTYMPHALGESC
jgi:hypothetical protein